MISVIIPVYNRESLIVETLESIKKQTFRDWECIVVDDGSTDNTLAVIADYIKGDRRFSVYERPIKEKKGPSSCRNYGFYLAAGDFIQFFDSDDIMHPAHLEKKAEGMGNADFILCRLHNFSGAFNSALFLSAERHEDIILEGNIFEDFVTGRFPMLMVAPMWRKQVLGKYMPMKSNMNILEDHELYARALFNHKDFKVLNEALIYVRKGNDSLTSSFFNDLDQGLDSYFEAKATVLSLDDSENIKMAILKTTLGFFRLGLAQKDYKNAEKCLGFIKAEKLIFNFKLRVAFMRIIMLYRIFKFIGRGDTKFKKLLKI